LSVPARLVPVTLRRAAFLLYTLALLVATLWPRLRLPGPEGTDKVTHALAFALWTFGLVFASWFGPLGSRRNLLSAAVIAPLFAGMDELAQLIPGIHRTCAWNDYAANIVGIAIGLALGLAPGLGRAKIDPPAPAGPEPDH
jgi:hypothetical protein